MKRPLLAAKPPALDLKKLVQFEAAALAQEETLVEDEVQEMPTGHDKASFQVAATPSAKHAGKFGFTQNCTAIPAPRLLDRSATFNQSMGRLQIRRVDAGWSLFLLRWHDPFHNLVNTNTAYLILLCLSVIVGSWLFFAALFRAVSQRCNLHADTFVKALYLAIETIETIGYGVEDPYFDGCYSGLVVLGATSLWESILTAVFISVVYTRISRPLARASSICFSEKAVIVEVSGAWHLVFQVCDFRKHQLCEAHIRMYSIQHADVGTVSYQTRAMRLQHPDDELGGMLLLALPQLVVHRIDPWSPLWPGDGTGPRAPGETPANSFRFPEIPQRGADGENGNREPGAAPAATSRQAAASKLDHISIAKHLAETQLEFLCVLEGIDASTSSTLQARHSYSCDDIVFNAWFQKCVQRADDGKCEVNFNRFHQLVALDEPVCFPQSIA